MTEAVEERGLTAYKLFKKGINLYLAHCDPEEIDENRSVYEEGLKEWVDNQAVLLAKEDPTGSKSMTAYLSLLEDIYAYERENGETAEYNTWVLPYLESAGDHLARCGYFCFAEKLFIHAVSVSAEITQGYDPQKNPVIAKCLENAADAVEEALALGDQETALAFCREAAFLCRQAYQDEAAAAEWEKKIEEINTPTPAPEVTPTPEPTDDTKGETGNEQENETENETETAEPTPEPVENPNVGTFISGGSLAIVIGVAALAVIGGGAAVVTKKKKTQK